MQNDLISRSAFARFLVWVAFILFLSACSPFAATQPVGNGSLPLPGQTVLPIIETAGVATGTATASPTPENIPDLSGETISVPALCDQSSILASGNAGRVMALEDAADTINANGGIFGAEVDLQVIDTKGSPDEARQALARTIRELGEGPLILICDPHTEAALRETLNEQEIPVLGPGDFAERSGFVFGVDATPQQHLGFFIEDLLANWNERKPAGAGNEIRLALISWPPEFSGPLTSEEFLTDLADLGIQIVYQAELPAELNANVFDLIYSLRDANANVIYTNTRGFGLAALLNALQQLGLRQRYVVGAPAPAYDTQFFEYLVDPVNAEGLHLTSAWAWWSEAENPGIPLAGELGAGEGMNDWGYIQMAGAAALAQQALEGAILDVGHAALSPEAVTGALTTLEDYPVMSGVFIVDYSGGNRSLDELRTWVVGAAPGTIEISE